MSEVEATGLKTKEVPHNDDKTNGEHDTLHYPHSNNNNNTNSTMTTTTTRKQRLEGMSTIGMKGQRTIDAFYDVMWPILEKEGGWTLVRGTGNEEGLVIFCPPVTATAVEKKGGGGTEQVTTASVLPENLDMVQISTNLLRRDKHNNNNKDKNDDDDDANSHQTPPQQPKHHQPYSRNNNNNNKNTTIPELLHQQGPWTCICGNTNEEGTIRCEQCYGWRESFSTTTNTTITTTVNTTNNGNKKVACPLQEYYTNIRQIIEYILQNYHNTTTNNPTTSSSSLASSSKDVYIKASKAYIGVITNAMELFGESSSSSSSSNNHNNNNNRYDDDDDDDDMNNNNNHHHQQQQQHHHHHIPMSPNTRMTRQRFSDIAWKENRTHYEKNSSRIGKEYQVDVLPEVGSYYYHGDNNNNQKKKTTKDKDKRNMMEEEEEEEEVLYDQVWDSEKAQKSGKIDFIHHRVKSSIKEPAYDMLHQRNYQLPGFYDELLSKANPTDCSHWTSEERAKFRKLVFEKHEDMWQISEALGRPVRECVTYYLGKFKTSKDFRSLRRVMEKARDENPFKYPGEILCDKCGKGGKLVYCDSCDSHYHLMCQDPPLLEVPEGNDWKCNKCVESKLDEEEEKEEDTSNDVEVDTSNYCEEEEEEEAEVSSFEGKRSDIIDSDEKKKEAAVAAAAKPANDNDDVNATNDAMSYSSVSAGGGVGEGEGKRPHNGEIPTDNVPTPSAKKAKSSNAASNHNFEEEEETSMTSFVSDEVSGVDSEMVSRSQHHHHQQQQLQQQSKEQPPSAADTNEKAP